ncbi:sodium:calcium antiporter [Alteribacter keqinensis]|uniref:Sodium:calcium antiporter n=1 Tax=Alteribacter keqinensis TaxID=2483800 RepID=A0A3M7TW75_9BACI|nr:sodium:calcium antiporter [Alteribacter keqinensis]RNA69920.1 sodium:calcium antiporter [Alteribacter keqinensis]
MFPFVLFALAAAVTVIAAVRLSTYADVISDRTSLGGMMVGTLLLAGATSLPEVTTSATAVFVGSPDIAVGNVLGSNLFNLMILASFDIMYRKKRLLGNIHSGHQMSGFVSLALTALVMVMILAPTGVTILGIGIEMYLMVFFYVYSLRKMNEQEKAVPEIAAANEEGEEALQKTTSHIPLKNAKIGFVISAAVIFVAGSLLTIAGDQIATTTGLEASFVGSFFIAAATSLPEVVTVLVALQLANYNLAVGNILGSNVFNMMILVVSDALFRSGAILGSVSPVLALTAFFAIVLNLIVLGHMVYLRQKSPNRFYLVPSVVLLIVYFVASIMMF